MDAYWVSQDDLRAQPRRGGARLQHRKQILRAYIEPSATDIIVWHGVEQEGGAAHRHQGMLSTTTCTMLGGKRPHAGVLGLETPWFLARRLFQRFLWTLNGYERRAGAARSLPLKFTAWHW